MLTFKTTFIFKIQTWTLVLLAFLASHAPLSAQEPQTVEPTKADLIKTLETIYPLLESQNYTAASAHVMMPPGMEPNDLSGLLRARELSLPGIKVLAKDARFGKATDVFGAERATHFANKMKADVTECYGFNHETEQATAEVIGQWDGTKFKLVRIDDVGKLVGAASGDPSDSKMPAKPSGKVDVAGNANSAESAETAESAKPDLRESREEIIRNAVVLIQELQATVEQRPSDVGARARLAMAFYKVGNYPAAWLQLMAAYKVDPAHDGVARGIDAVIVEFTKTGVFTVGVPPETIQALLGEPNEILDLKMRKRWMYAHWGIDFSDGRVGEIIDLRGAKASWYEPTEKISTDLGGETWLPGFRAKEKGKGIVYYFVPGESMASHTHVVTVERMVDAPGTLKEIVDKQLEDATKLVPETMLRVLVPGEDSVILASRIMGQPKSKTRHQLIRLWRAQKDLFRLTYTIISENEPDQKTQQKWMGIFQKASLDRVE